MKKTKDVDNEYLTRCVVNVLNRTIYIYSSEGTERKVSCDTSEEFLNVLQFIRSTLGEDILSYTTPL